MNRRVLAVAAAAATAVAILPVTPAFASAAASAALDSNDAEVLPGAGQVFDITVTNDEAGGVVGGKSINAVRVILPSQIGLRTVSTQTAPDGWTVTPISANGLEQYVFRTTGAGIPSSALGRAAGSLAFPVLANVLQPSLGDRAGALQVGVSSDGGSTFRNATGDLGTTIRTLQVTGLKVIGDARVTDGTGTAGQKINTVVSVKNHALNGQSVTPTLTSNAGLSDADTIGAVAPQTVNSGQTFDFTVPVTLGKVGSDLTRRFEASASSPRPSSAGKFVSALDYGIQVAPRLSLVSSTFAPTDVRSGLSYSYAVDAAKSGTPTLAVTGGSLSFIDDDDVTAGTVDIQTGDFAGGASSGTVKSDELAFVAGDTGPKDGQYDAVYALTAVDGNGFVLTDFVDNATLVDRLNLDNLGPLVTAGLTLPLDQDGDRTTAVRNYDGSNALTLSGTYNDTRATAQTIALQCLTGTGALIQPASAPTVSGGSFSASFQPTFPADCGSVRPVVSFKDPAGNIGTAKDQLSYVVDNVVPTIEKQGLFGAVVNIPTVDPAKPAIQVNIFDAQLGVIGGCDPRSYSVDGQLMVQGVYVLEDGVYRECTIGSGGTPGSAKPSGNDRYLRVSQEITRGGTTPQPVVTYDPARNSAPNLGSVRLTDRIKDAAGNYAPRGLQDTVTRLVPDAPTLVDVTRNKGSEQAVLDNGVYYTRFSGSDLAVTVEGGVAGDTLEVYPKGKTGTADRVGSAAVTGGQAQANVVLAATEAVVQEFELRFRSGSGVLGLPAPLAVQYDETLPLLSSTEKTGASTASVQFAEPVLGDNAALNWSVFENVPGEQEGTTERAFRGVNAVTGAGAARNMDADFTSAPYGGAQYFYLDGLLYEDRAGNKLAKQVLVSAG